MIASLLEHPLTRGMDLDHPETTELRRRIIREKSFLRRCYDAWYAAVAAAVPEGPGDVLEIGSGAGFLADVIPGLITSDVLALRGIQLVASAEDIPLPDASLRAITMVNVLHHVPGPRAFFREAARSVRPGGRVIMLEPWVSRWSRLVYTRLHHEPFEPAAEAWEFPPAGPLSGANGALPWIMFERDRAAFEAEFPMWRIVSVTPMMPFRYLLSGGVSMRALMPGWTFGAWGAVERGIGPWMRAWAMFALVVLEHQPVRAETAPSGAGV